ncbi:MULTISPECIES: gp16 family protein [Xanthomonas]|uniref:Regulatory protein GemA n=2 Tax=Xanthomonas TaxID=338 RepID=A0A7Z7J132_XANCH|nr:MULTISPECIES: regulatory protein GemA [Xanthomonas]ATS38436.1 regulatory protein GemA [Xanthomonas citri pv. phaseoli var. fuscans]ATS42764.1 regulatory protein GemA [Xanthomonas citri pv. phaseoli var. fuscans]ATS46436.1 regulatory protein GemA [Xanthomonas citri pv. phaseoli var. fuscans]ATS83306.1 regulatory protein GemA [Xanthomonas citri pv. phaseoli var. fuscans]QWN20095.1 regulatory protein GemA [Xanthomonas citri]
MSLALSTRKTQLAKIHLAAKQKGLDEATYRALLVRITGKDSAAKMTVEERALVIAEFVRLGFKDVQRTGRKRQWPGQPKNLDEVPMLRKVQALLADAKRPWAYAHNTAKQMYGIDSVEFLNQDQLHRLVAALQVDANRRK